MLRRLLYRPAKGEANNFYLYIYIIVCVCVDILLYLVYSSNKNAIKYIRTQNFIYSSGGGGLWVEVVYGWRLAL